MATVLDGTGLVMGRLASVIAKRLRQGEEIEVVNCEAIIVSGKKHVLFKEYHEKQRIGGYRDKGPNYPKMPHLIFKRTVRGMVKFTMPAGRNAMKRFRAHIGVPLPLYGQTFEVVEDAKPRGGISYVPLGDIAKAIGAKFR